MNFVKLLLLKLYNLFYCSIKGMNMSVREKTKTYLGFGSRIINPKQISINESIVGKYCYISAQSKHAKITIGKGSNIGMYCMIASINYVKIGENVLFGPNVYVADYNHEYRDINVPVAKQGKDSNDNTIIIEDDGWIGKNVVIVGNVHIGKHCVVGANSLVNRDLPDYSVCVGNPCRPVKQWNGIEWERV